MMEMMEMMEMEMMEKKPDKEWRTEDNCPGLS